jgi:hypothetical protein
MPSFPGSQNAAPGVYTDVVTLSRGANVPGGVRTAVLMGEGLKTERLVSSAVGGGSDGLNPTYSSANGSDGRHFLLAGAPLVSNRLTLYKNGIPLNGLEQAFSSTSGSFSSLYDYRVNITNGRIELQVASLVDQGGSYYSTSALNQGDGSISSLTLVDQNAPTETWTIRCTSVRRDGYGNPIDGYAKFIAQGSVSGTLRDGYGNNIVWTSDNTVVSNGILSFAIAEGGTAFSEGDKFTVKVKSGALVRGDSLTATYISQLDINDPQFFTDPNTFAAKHGFPSLENRLAIGAQLAFANNPPGIWAVQCAPSIPRRLSYTLEVSASGSAALDDLKFSLPLGILPDADANINFFVTDPATETESQIIPNKVTFYDSAYALSPSSFCFGPSTYSYTVILEDAVVKEADDGEITVSGELSSEFVVFDTTDVGKTLKILTPNVNAGSYTIVSVADGVATISGGPFTATTGMEFQVIDNTAQTAAILLTDDVALSAGQSLRVTVVDTKDADFFDAGWAAALDSLEAIDVSMVVPLPSQTISVIMQNAKNHCETMSNIKNKKERLLFTGAIRGLTPENLTGTEDAAIENIGILEGIQGDDVSEILAGNIEDLANYSVANAFGNSYRVVYFYPDEIVVQVGADNQLLDGLFIAAAAAGYLSGVPALQIPLTRKNLSGFTILRNKLLRPIILEGLLYAGVSVVQPIAGGGKVVWGRTTTTSGFPEEEEISIIFCRDRVAQSLRAGLEAFIGVAEDSTLQGSLITRVLSILKGLKGQKVITNFKDVKVTQNDTDARQWDVTCRVRPAYPVNWIYVRVEVGDT